ncbi:MAG: response regulator transcription factor [Microbacterium sp.]|nr:MAG: response regulator transcription factor [Microbacterium sp.]
MSHSESRQGHSEQDDVDEALKVLLVNRRDIVRRGLRAVLEDSEDLVVVAETAHPGNDPAGSPRAAPDVAVIDAADAAATAEALRKAHAADGGLPTIVVGHDENQTRRIAAAATAAAYLLDDARESEVRETVRRVARGHGGATTRSAWRRESRSARPDVSLTLRERQVLGLISGGLTNREIGAELGLAEKTVKNYISAMFAKLHVAHRTQAAVYGITHGMPSSAPSDADD